MEDVCIVCNRAIEWSTAELDTQQPSTSSAKSNGTSSPVSAGMQRGTSSTRSSSNPGAPSAVTASKASSTTGGEKLPSKKAHHHSNSHHHVAVKGHHHARIKRNQSHGKLDKHHHHHAAKSGIKPLTSTATNAAAISAAVNAIVNGECIQRYCSSYIYPNTDKSCRSPSPHRAILNLLRCTFLPLSTARTPYRP